MAMRKQKRRDALCLEPILKQVIYKPPRIDSDPGVDNDALRPASNGVDVAVVGMGIGAAGIATGQERDCFR
jgi:hypothetical protein